MFSCDIARAVSRAGHGVGAQMQRPDQPFCFLREAGAGLDEIREPRI
jgi:hypothetical protein